MIHFIVIEIVNYKVYSTIKVKTIVLYVELM